MFLDAYGPVLFLEKGGDSFTRSGHGWATAAGVLDDSGKLILTRDRERETIPAAASPDRIDWSAYLPRGFMNDSHRAKAIPGASCTGKCQGSPDPSCAVHGGKRASVLIGLPDRLEHAPAGHDLADRDGKVGWYTWFHLADPKDRASWLNPDGTSRSRMLRDGTVTDEPWDPTPEEKDRADYHWESGLAMQREGRTKGLSIQGRETVIPDDGGHQIVRASAHQVAIIDQPHNPEATIEGFGREMAKGEAPIVVALADRFLRDPVLRRRFQITDSDVACSIARHALKEMRLYHG